MKTGLEVSQNNQFEKQTNKKQETYHTKPAFLSTLLLEAEKKKATNNESNDTMINLCMGLPMW